jgi:hypothetical protein
VSRGWYTQDLISFDLGDVHEPLGEYFGVGYRAFAEVEILTYLSAVGLDRAPGPVVERQLGRLDPDLAGDEVHDLVRELGPSTRK